ncbi:MAG: hypothetical protein HQL51_12195 [Magnetococcales bacterium]|nr:hypothetical protein [Magnetococcales bacterium]
MTNSTQWGRTVGAAVIVVVLMAGLAGCDQPEGKAERAGKEIDKTVQKVGQKIEEAGDNMQKPPVNDKK